jgi:hypothetical protein
MLFDPVRGTVGHRHEGLTWQDSKDKFCLWSFHQVDDGYTGEKPALFQDFPQL